MSPEDLASIVTLVAGRQVERFSMLSYGVEALLTWLHFGVVGSSLSSDVCSDGQELGPPSRVAVVSPSFCLWNPSTKAVCSRPLASTDGLLRFTDECLL